jgi:hypothetical protein
MESRIKIYFKIKQDEDGYPPVAVESVWAQPTGRFFRIDSIPFFTRDATVGDVVRATADPSGALWFSGVEKSSGNSLIRVVLFDPNFSDVVANGLKALGCGTEGMKVYKLLAVDVPEGVELGGVQAFLRGEADVGRIDYEEAILRQ